MGKDAKREARRAKEAAELKKQQEEERNRIIEAKRKSDLLAAKKKIVAVKPLPKLDKIQKLVTERNVEKLKAQGYKIVAKNVTDKQGKVMGVRTNISDLVLMEKKL